MAPPKKQTGLKIGWSHMLRDVFVESIKKGQLPLAGFIFLFAIALWKTPESYLPTLWARIFDLQNSICLIGLFLNFGLIFGWKLHASSQRRTFTNELTRVTEERNRLQQERITLRLESSKQK